MADPRCPVGCGWPTDDPTGSPCSVCWSELHPVDPRLWADDRYEDPGEGYLEVCGSWRPIVSVDPGRFL